MWLIDGSKLKATYLNGRYGVDALEVLRAPTVNAIPVEWITKYLHELNKQAEEELDFIINELGGYDTCYKMEYVIGIEKMLEKWEKENELDKVQ